LISVVGVNDHIITFVDFLSNNQVIILVNCSVLPLPVSTGRPRPPLSKKSIDFYHEIMENEKKL
jgi:hypothetical protein